MQRRLLEVVEKFRQNGATTPEKTLTPQELGLPPRFEQAMHRHLGSLGIFVEVNGGKYYLVEERFRQLQEQWRAGDGAGEAGNSRRTMATLRIARLATTLLVVVLVLANIFIQNWTIRLISAGLIVVWLMLFVAFIYYSRKPRQHFRIQTH